MNPPINWISHTQQDADSREQDCTGFGVSVFSCPLTVVKERSEEEHKFF
jgi:hypothetical protein